MDFRHGFAEMYCTYFFSMHALKTKKRFGFHGFAIAQVIKLLFMTPE